MPNTRCEHRINAHFLHMYCIKSLAHHKTKQIKERKRLIKNQQQTTTTACIQRQYYGKAKRMNGKTNRDKRDRQSVSQCVCVCAIADCTPHQAHHSYLYIFFRFFVHMVYNSFLLFTSSICLIFIRRIAVVFSSSLLHFTRIHALSHFGWPCSCV